MRSQLNSSVKLKIKIPKVKAVKRFGKETKIKNKKSLLKRITSKLINGSGKSSGYAYTNTRVRVMKSKLLTSETYRKLLKMQSDEITRYLEETEYRKEIDELAVRYEGINLIEYGLTQNLENTFNKIHNFSIGLSREQIKLYLKKWDIWNVKTILRGKYANASKDEITNSIVAAGSSPLSFWENVIDKADSVKEVIEMLHGNPFYEELKENSDDLGKMEDLLDRFYYEFVLEYAEPELRKYIVEEINTINTLNSLRSEHLGDYNYWIKGGTELIQVSQDLEKLEKRIFLRKNLVQDALKMVHEFKKNIRPVLGYFIAKENEIRNLRIIVRGKHAGLPVETIEAQLVM